MKLKYLTALLAVGLVFSGCLDTDSEEEANVPTTANTAQIDTELAKAITAETNVANAKELQNNLVNVQSTSSLNFASSAYNDAKPVLFALKTLEILKYIESNSVKKAIAYAPVSINETQNCSVSGTRTINVSGNTDKPYPDYTKIILSACNENGVSLNGQVEINFTGDGLNLNSQTIGYITDFSIRGLGISQTIKAGSRIVIDQMQADGSGFRLNQTYIMLMDGRTFGSKDLIYMFSNVNTTASYYPVSGREYINEIANYFDVDTSYDASLSPFTSNGTSLQVGGLFKYIGANGNKLEVEITGSNEVTVRADSNGDGIFDFNTETEVYSIN